MKRILSASSGPRGLSAFFSLILLFAAGVSSAVPAAAAGGVDAVLVMDSSGSMAKNDPKKLRVPAAKLFISLLDSEDRIGLISFSDNGYPVLHLTTPIGDSNARILASADKVSSKGVYTNLYAALSKGIEMLGKEGKEGQEKMLVLMSDGKMDVGDSDEDWALTQKLQDELLQVARDKGIKVYTIAFTEASDVELLKQVAKETGALFKLARSDQDLHEVFSAIFESAKDPDMLPIEGGEFMVDGSIEEVTIVASKEREDVRIYLQSPDGSKLGAENAGDELKWFLSQHFDMITLRKPEPGAWKLLFTGGRNRAYIVTNMALNHNPQRPGLTAGQDMVLESWLEQDGKLLDKEALLTNTRFLMEIQDPNGATARFDLFDRGEYGDRKPADGVYSNTLSYENAGSYQIRFIAESETFQRQKTVHFEVAPAPAGLAKPEPEQAALAEPQSEADQKVEPETEPDVTPQPAPEPADAEAGQAADPAASLEEDTEQQPLPGKKKDVSLVLVAGVFIGVNLLLGAIGFGVWWILKRRNKTGSAEAEDEEAEEG
ncbi:MAG: VWA domain-containing protein [Pseudomonadota bacterium]|nr:VWA domain-containing protein [Pseudomonadota bacterium]